MANAKTISANAKAISAKSKRRLQRLTTEPSESSDSFDRTIDTNITADAQALNPDSDGELEAAAEAKEPASLELSSDDVDALARQADASVEQERVGLHKFVVFKDVLPPCPPRGQFDVRRIKDSAYFFS